MEAYTSFAVVYDTFMDNVPYEEWGEYLHGLLLEYVVEDGLVLDLGCGTGTMTEILASKGYDMTGVDFSEEMLDIAMQKRTKSGHDILYLMQDMREFELYGTVRAIVSICDSMNYLTEDGDLEQVFRLANNYLDPGGLFIFDMNTEYKYREMLGDQTIAEERENCSFIWDNYYYEEEKINEYQLSLFVEDPVLSEKTGQDICRKFQEMHYQRAYSLAEVKAALEVAGMEFIAAYDAFTRNPVHQESERMYIIAREQGK